eukprot:CAMPEP_0184395544 /NCGR_PEP_ID=MMETSP0007-20130409/44770_1 /TAXON_ID=97485 /ORGANISM="Prymnesium parvum, Strain Texoma1" /LENGTH=117 /DNA_ID=CAMNT_0026747781 /DNA_START=238 /DNA_END=588 /DNA_ORIENTATION=+
MTPCSSYAASSPLRGGAANPTHYRRPPDTQLSMATSTRVGSAGAVVVREDGAAVGRDEDARAADVVDAVLLVDAAAALGEVDAVHLVVDPVLPHGGVPPGLGLHAVLLVAVDVVRLE